MKKRCFILIGFLLLFILGCNGQNPKENKSLKLIGSIPLSNVNGRIDHLSFDPVHQIVFVAALRNNSVEIVDIKNRKTIHTIKNLAEPQGILYLPESNSIFVSNGDNGICDVFDALTFNKSLSIKLSGDADNVRYDSAGKKIYVGYGNGAIAIIDATNFKIIADIKLDGHPESFQIDSKAQKIYVNVPDKKHIEIIDLEKRKVVDKWMMKEAFSNFPMCLDDENHLLFVGCRIPSKLLLIDSQTGKTNFSVNIDKDVDDIFYDRISNQVFLSCGEGYIDIFKKTGTTSLSPTGKISTETGARTSLFVPELNQLIVASPSGFNKTASILIYQLILDE